MTQSSEPATAQLPYGLDVRTLEDLEASAVEAAERAGEFVAGRFGGEMAVEEKEDATRSLVTDVDIASQRLVGELIAARYPGHLLLGEEEPPEADPPAPDFVWAVDPIDGTTNFVNGFPAYAVSIAVLFRGSPVAGACYVPWPNEERKVVYHCRLNGGAWAGDERLRVKGPNPGPAPEHGRVTFVPMGIARQFHLGTDLRRSLGEPRVSGSLVVELLMVASGTAQLIVGAPAAPWDYAAGMLMIKEAGGTVVTPDLAPDGSFLPRWSGFATFDRAYEEHPQTVRRLRAWRRPVIAGAPEVVAFAAENLRPRQTSLLTRIKRSLLGEGRG